MNPDNSARQIKQLSKEEISILEKIIKKEQDTVLPVLQMIDNENILPEKPLRQKELQTIIQEVKKEVDTFLDVKTDLVPSVGYFKLFGNNRIRKIRKTQMITQTTAIVSAGCLAYCILFSQETGSAIALLNSIAGILTTGYMHSKLRKQRYDQKTKHIQADKGQHRTVQIHQLNINYAALLLHDCPTAQRILEDKDYFDAYLLSVGMNMAKRFAQIQSDDIYLNFIQTKIGRISEQYVHTFYNDEKECTSEKYECADTDQDMPDACKHQKQKHERHQHDTPDRNILVRLVNDVEPPGRCSSIFTRLALLEEKYGTDIYAKLLKEDILENEIFENDAHALPHHTQYQATSSITFK